MFRNVNDALEDHSVGGISWHSIIDTPKIDKGVIALFSLPVSLFFPFPRFEKVLKLSYIDDNDDEDDVVVVDDGDGDDEDEDDVVVVDDGDGDDDDDDDDEDDVVVVDGGDGDEEDDQDGLASGTERMSLVSLPFLVPTQYRDKSRCFKL